MNYKIIIKIIFSILLIAIIIYSINFNDFVNSIKNANILFLLIGLSSTIPGILISTYKWQILLISQNIKRVKFIYLWKLYYIGMFFNNFLPTEVGGDVVRSYSVGKRVNKLTESFAAVTMERLTGLFAMLLYGVLGIIMNWDFALKFGLTKIGVICFGIALIFVIIFFNKRLMKILYDILDKTPVAKMVYKMKSFYLAIVDYINKKEVLFKSMFWSVIFQLIAITSIYFFLLSVNINIDFSLLILIVPMITIISLLPIGINGIGLREGSFVFLFSLVGVNKSDAFVVSLFYRVCTLLPSILGGIFYSFHKNVVEKIE